MKRIRCIYMFWFYKLYLFGEKNSTYGLNDWKSVFIIGMFEMFTMLSIYIYWGLYRGEVYIPENPTLPILITSLILGIKHYRFYYKNEKWKKYISFFNRCGKSKVKKYSKLYYAVSLILILNIFLMYILLYSVG